MYRRAHDNFFSIALLGLLSVCACRGDELKKPPMPETTTAAHAPELPVADDQVHSVETYDRTRYDLIIARSPFGDEPDEAAKTPAADPVVQQLERDLRLCFLLEGAIGEVRAGFQNTKPKKDEPKSVMLMVGESFRTMKLVDIDLKNSTATMEYQGKQISFELTRGKTATATNPANTPAPPTASQRRFGGGFRRTTPSAEPQPQPQPQPEEPILSPEELAAQQAQMRENLQQYQMEVIRSGMPPLPVQLTQEMDDQLVAEGVLPPLE